MDKKNKELSVSKKNVESIYDLSPMQTGMIFQSVKDSESGIYITQQTFKLADVDVEAVEKAWQDVIQHFAVFRTVFSVANRKQPYQIVLNSTEFNMLQHDWSDLTPEQQESNLNKLLLQLKREGFTLNQAPLMKVDFIRLCARQHYMVWTHHHIILDGWSLPMVLDALNKSYIARSNGKKPSFPAAQPYESYIQWLKRQDQQQAKEFWRNYLAHLEGKSLLPLTRSDRPVSAQPAQNYDMSRFELSKDLTGHLKQCARHEHVTLNELLQTAWGILLHRLTGSDDIVFGAVTSGRPPELPNAENIVGLLINTVPIRIQLNDHLSIQDVLQILHDGNTRLRSYEYASLADINHWIEFTGTEGLFDTLIAFENFPLEEVVASSEGLPVISVEGSERPHNPLTLACIPGEFLSLHFYYDEYYFEASALDRIYHYLELILQAFVEDLSQGLRQINLLSRKEWQLVVEKPNNTKVPLPRTNLARTFERIVITHADNIALICANKTLSYRQFNNRANQLARHLQHRGVVPGQVVALLFNRSIDAVVAMMAVIKAGAAYLPLDTKYPQEHLSHMLVSSEATLVLTRERDKKLPKEIPTIELRDYLLDTYPKDNLSITVLPQAPAYVMYTSGSTGLPKGVMTTHQAVLRLVTDSNYLPISHEDTFLQLAPTVFDAATLEIWGPLLHGARLAIAPPSTVDVNDLDEIIRTQGVTTLWLTAAFFHLLVRENIQALTGLRYLLAGGDVLSPKAVAQVLEQFPDLQLINGYGPTENTTFTCCHLIHKVIEGSSIPIGSPITNTTTYVLCRHLEPVGVGVVGKLYTGGSGLAYGYLNDPCLTAHSFIPDHFSTDPGSRLYRTGDLVRWRNDQTLEFMGRQDNQVKVRGFRIELGEIEAQLNRHSQIREAVVLLREEGNDKQLIAFYIPTAQQSPSASSLRSYLLSQLPGHMVPAFYVARESFPITANGKLDRKAILVTGKIERHYSDNTAEPTTEAQHCLLGIWQEVLKDDDVGIHDNFFELGGDSVLSLQIASRANKAGYPLKIKDIFANPTVYQLARCCTQTSDGILQGQAITAAFAPQEAISGEQILLPIQQWLFAQNLKHPNHWNQSFLINIPSDLTAVRLENYLQKMLKHHDVFRLRFTKNQEQWYASYHHQPKPITVNSIVLSGLAEEQQNHQIKQLGELSKANLDLQHGPIIQALLFEFGNNKQLLLTVHHLVIDTTSWRILLEDLELLYSQDQRDQALLLPDKTTPYQYWGKKLQDHATNPALIDEHPFWSKIPGEKTATRIDKEAEKDANTNNTLTLVSEILGQQETKQLLEQANQAYNTRIDELLLCAFARAYKVWGNKNTLTINLEGHGREELFDDVDLGRTVGWFTTIFPVNLNIEGISVISDIITVKEQLRAIPNKGIGFGLLKYYSHNHIPDPQAFISFNYLGQLDQTFSRDSLFSYADDRETGLEVNKEELRCHLLDVVANVADGQLGFHLYYSDAFYLAETIQSLANEIGTQLRGIIDHCLQPCVGRLTPADITLTTLDELDLQDVLMEVGANRTPYLVNAIYPASPLQTGMLVETLKQESGSGVYITQPVFHLQGELDVAALEMAWKKLIDHFAIFRTAFAYNDRQEALQVVFKSISFNVQKEDWRHLPVGEQKQQLEHFLLQDKRKGFTLNQLPLMRVALIQVADNEYFMVWTHHHIVLDGWSLPYVLDTLNRSYINQVQGNYSPLGMAEPYEAYIRWLKKQDQEEAKKFWQDYLTDIEEKLPLPLVRSSRPMGALPSQDYADVKFELPFTLSEELREQARSEHITLNILIQAAWAILLSRYTHQSDIVFGAVTSGRPPELPNAEKIVGLLINTVPVRASLDDKMSISDLLKRLHEDNIKLRTFEYAALADINKWINYSNAGSLFDTIVAFENYPLEQAASNNTGLPVASVDGSERPHNPLTLACIPGERLLLRLFYDQYYFESHVFDRLYCHLTMVLEAMANNASQQLRAINILNTEERKQVVEIPNATQKPYPRSSIATRFEQAAQQQADNHAVVFGEQHLSYRELNKQANQLAHRLQQIGVFPGDTVALLFERSIDSIVAILSVVKLGAIYLPLDPESPVERLHSMIKAVRARFLITHNSKLSSSINPDIHKTLSSSLMVINLSRETLDDNMADNPNIAVLPQSAAYIMYTSGSTGQPKGVVVSHQAVLRLVNDANYLPINRDHVFLQLAPITFDASTLEIWGALLNGACLVVAPAGTPEIEDLGKLIQHHQVSILWLTASFFHLVVRENIQVLNGLQYLLAGGDVLSPEAVSKALSQLPELTLINGYGPTENTTFTCCHSMHTSLRGGTIPIGCPISNTTAYVLDDKLEPVGVGIVGELYAGGDGLAYGYLNFPAMTACAFVPDSFSETPGNRLYQTGDLVRWREDGTLEFMGRKDQQLKIRGFRIEPGEIEDQLNRHEQIRETVVMVNDEGENKHLMAFYIPREGSHPSAIELRSYLLARLPVYMVPAFFVGLEAFPLTSNGKLDRRQLLATASMDCQQQSANYAIAQNDIERTLVNIWQDVLRHSPIGVHDNFFELGGDSILSMQIASRATKQGYPINVKDVFNHPSIYELAKRCGEENTAIFAPQDAIEGEQILLPIQQWFFDEDYKHPNHWNQSFLVYAPTNFTLVALKTILPKLIEAHDILRLLFTRTDSATWQAHYQQAGDNNYFLESHDLRNKTVDEQTAALQNLGLALKQKLDLSNGPIFAVALFNLGKTQRLLLTMHHLIVDIVSWRIILGDLEHLYSQYQNGTELRLHGKTTPYQYWAEQLRDFTRNGSLAEEVSYWTRPELNATTKFVHADYALEMDANTIQSTALITVSMDEQETQALLERVHSSYNTRIEETLLCALTRAFYHWSGEKSLLVSLEGHGREGIFDDVDLARTVGWFTTIYPMYFEISGDHLAADIPAVKEQFRSLPNKGTGYGLLKFFGQEEISSQLKKHEFPVSFNYLGQFKQTFEDNSLFGFAQEDSGADIAYGEHRTHMLDIVARVQDGKLWTVLYYSDKFYKESTIQSLGEAFCDELRNIIDHCLLPDSGCLTPSDITLAQLNEDELLEVLKLVDAKDAPYSVAAVYPASPMQAGMLVETLKHPGSGIYITQPIFKLRGQLDINALEAAWADVINRYAIFRTAFAHRDHGKPLQIVFKSIDLQLHKADWRQLSADKQTQQLDEFLLKEQLTGFDLSRTPLMRVALQQLSDDEYCMIWTHHHIILDGWSLPMVLGTLNNCYAAHIRGHSSPNIVEEPYESYIRWIAKQDQQAAEKFWFDYLDGFDEKLSLPLIRNERSKDALPGQNYQDCSFHIAEELATKLTEFSRHEHVTLSTIIQAAWGILLHRLTDTDDIVFGAVTSGRPPELPNAESIVGLLINTVPIRIQLDNDPSIKDVLRTLHKDNTQLRSYEYAALADISRWVHFTDSGGLFDTIIAFENFPLETAPSSGVGLPIVSIQGNEQPHNPLTLACIPGESLLLQFFYDEYYFETSVFDRFYRYLVQVLKAFVEDPCQSLRQIKLLSKEERQQLIEQANDTQAPLTHTNLIQAFEHIVTTHADTIALTSGLQSLSYQQLNNRANQLSHRLQDQGIVPGQMVALQLHRSIDTIVAIIAVIKAGAVYLPLDANSPAEHINQTLANAKVSLVLTRDYSDTLADHIQTIKLSDDLLDTYPTTNLPISVLPKAPAYVMYTSGSTGLPKGIITTHHSVLRLVTDPDYLSISSEDTFLQLAPTAFDAATLEIWGPLLNGARLVMAPPGTVDVDDLGELIRTQRVTTLWLTAAFFHLVVRENIQVLAGLSYLLVGGDVLSPNAVAQVLKQFPDLHLINGYGPTENTTFTCCHKIQQVIDGGSIPIGKPISNTTAYVLCRHLEPVGVGVVGELYTGGNGLAHGYLHDPSLTACSFLPNHFSTEPGERLYRTGDLVRWRPDWTLAFMGRQDDQVKVRGFRIELGEIEAHLNRHEQIREAVVLIRQQSSNKQLVAFYIPEANQSPDASALRSYLLEQLPSHMVPTFFVVQEAFPITSNGKLDKKALLTTKKIERHYSDSDVAPTTKAERCLLDIWREVLKDDKAGVHDNFFELGGDSILSLQIASRASKAGYSLKIKDIFTYPTVHELARSCTQSSDGLTPQGRAITAAFAPQEAITGEQILLPIQQWFFAQNLKHPNHWNQSFLFDISNESGIDNEQLTMILEKLLESHDVFRLRFDASNGDGKIAQYNPQQSGHFIVKTHDLSKLSEAQQLAQLELQGTKIKQRLNLNNGPLIGAAIFNMAIATHVLITVHHLVIDTVSWLILIKDIELLLSQQKQGKALQLQNKTTPYQYWAEKLQAHGESAELKMELSFWQRKELQKASQKPFMDKKARAEANTIKTVKTAFSSLSTLETKSLMGLANQAYSTGIDELLLCGLARSFANIRNNQPLLVSLEGHGREELFEDVDLTNTIGWFTNIYPVLLKVEGGILAKDIVAVKKQLQSIPNKGMGYGVLKYFSDEQLVEINPVISYTYLGQFDDISSKEATLRFIHKNTGKDQHNDEIRNNFLDIVAIVQEGQLGVSFYYSDAIYEETTINDFIESYLKELRSIALHCTVTDINTELANLWPDRSPLTYTQLDQWFMYLQTGNPWPISLEYEINGYLHKDNLEKAINSVLIQHQVFWGKISRFIPEQQFVSPHYITLPFYNLSKDKEDQAEKIEQIFKESLQLNPSEVPLIKFILVKITPSKHLLMLTLTHLAVDRLSISLFLQEISTAYKQISNKETPPARTPLQINEAVESERKRFSKEKLKNDIAYWENALDGVQPVWIPETMMIQEAEGNEMKFIEIPQEKIEKLIKFCNKIQATLQMGIVSLINILLNKTTGSDDIVISIHLNGRDEIDNQFIIAPLYQELLIRTKNVNTDFEQVTTSVKQFMLTSLEHKNCPWIIPTAMVEWAKWRTGAGFWKYFWNCMSIIYTRLINRKSMLYPRILSSYAAFLDLPGKSTSTILNNDRTNNQAVNAYPVDVNLNMLLQKTADIAGFSLERTTISQSERQRGEAYDGSQWESKPLGFAFEYNSDGNVVVSLNGGGLSCSARSDMLEQLNELICNIIKEE